MYVFVWIPSELIPREGYEYKDFIWGAIQDAGVGKGNETGREGSQHKMHSEARHHGGR